MNCSKDRNSSFEFLRLLLMVMIIIHHCIVHGLGLSVLGTNYNKTLILADNQMALAIGVNTFCICAVNCFILISGYFTIHVSAKRFLNILFSLVIYTLLFAIIPLAIEEKWRLLVNNLFFLSHSPYWFVIDYLFLMVFAPMLNLGFEVFSKFKRRLILFGLVIISCYFGFLWCHSANSNGYTILQFITMYCIGREIRISKPQISISKSSIIYSGASVLISIVGYFCWKIGRNDLVWRTTYYNDPLLIISSIGLFMVFKKIRFHSSIINRIAKSAFGIYLFQSSSFVASKIYAWLQIYGPNYGDWIFLIIVIIAILIAFVAIMIDQIRILTLKVTLPSCLDLYEKLKKYLVHNL